MKTFIHLQNFKDNPWQSQLRHVLKFANIRLQNINTTMLIARSCRHQKCIKNFKAIPHKKKKTLVLVFTQELSNYPLTIKMRKQIMSEPLQALPHTKNSKVSGTTSFSYSACLYISQNGYLMVRSFVWCLLFIHSFLKHHISNVK